MAGAFVQSFENSDNSSSSTGLTVTVSGATANNLLVAISVLRGSSETFSAVPTGWTEFPSSPDEGAGSTVSTAMYRRIASGDSNDNLVTSHTGAEEQSVVGEYSGLATTTPLEDDGVVTQASVATISPAATATQANGMAISGLGSRNSDSWTQGGTTVDAPFVIDAIFRIVGNFDPLAGLASDAYTSSGTKTCTWNSASGSGIVNGFTATFKEPVAGTAIDATTDTLIIAEQAAIVQADVDVTITAGFDTLVIVEQGATVQANVDVNITATTDTLIITERVATVQADVDTNISAGLDTLIISEQIATVQLITGTVINATTDTLIITEQGATVQADVDTSITAGVDTLVITEQQATVSLAIGITIDGAVTKVLSTDFQSTTLYFNGSNYFTID